MRRTCYRFVAPQPRESPPTCHPETPALAASLAANLVSNAIRHNIDGGRMETQRLRQVGGHGLGLAIVSAIASAHSAELAARARPEGGLDITATFP